MKTEISDNPKSFTLREFFSYLVLWRRVCLLKSDRMMERLRPMNYLEREQSIKFEINSNTFKNMLLNSVNIIYNFDHQIIINTSFVCFTIIKL